MNVKDLHKKIITRSCRISMIIQGNVYVYLYLAKQLKEMSFAGVLILVAQQKSSQES